MSAFRVAILVGSNRQASINRQLANALADLLPTGTDVIWPRIDDLPLYNQDHDLDRASSVDRFTDDMLSADAVIIVTPEHNRSIPAVLKSALDWGSRPSERQVWRNKPIFITGTSPGAIGAALAQQHLRLVLGSMGALVIGGEVYVQFKPELFNEAGLLAQTDTKAWLQAHVDRFLDLLPGLDK